VFGVWTSLACDCLCAAGPAQLLSSWLAQLAGPVSIVLLLLLLLLLVMMPLLITLYC